MKPYQLCLALLLLFIFSCDKEDDTERNYFRIGSYETEIADVFYVMRSNRGEGFSFLGKGLNYKGYTEYDCIGGRCRTIAIDGEGAIVTLGITEDEFNVSIDQAEPFYVNERFEDRFISYLLNYSADLETSTKDNYIKGTYTSKSLGKDLFEIDIEGVDTENKSFRLHYSGKMSVINFTPPERGVILK